jgi:hypothetical protein
VYPHHLGAEYPDLHGWVGSGGSGYTAHQDTHHDADLRRPAVHAARDQTCQTKKARRDSRHVHQVAGEDEEWDCKGRERLALVQHHLGRDLEVNPLDREVGKTGDTNDEGDRHVEDEEDDEADQQECHAAYPSASARRDRPQDDRFGHRYYQHCCLRAM